MRSYWMIMVVGILVFAGGCHSSKPAETTQSTASTEAASIASPSITDPCKLLTQAEASAVLGEKLGPGELKRYGPVTRCQFYTGPDQELFLDVADEATFEALAHGPDVAPVSGIGDKALWQHDEYSTSLHILKGGNMVSMGLPRKMASMTPAVENAAKLIASRM